jgi:hypothetical protein
VSRSTAENQFGAKLGHAPAAIQRQPIQFGKTLPAKNIARFNNSVELQKSREDF